MKFHCLGYSFGTPTILKAYKDHLRFDPYNDTKIKSLMLVCGLLGFSDEFEEARKLADKNFKKDPTMPVLQSGRIAP